MLSEQTWLTVVWVLVLLVIAYVAVDLFLGLRKPRGGKRKVKQRRRGGGARTPMDAGEGAAGAHVDETRF